MNNTYTRHKTYAGGLLRPLESRMTDKQFERRTMKAVTRLRREHAQTRGAINLLFSIIGRKFWGRMKYTFLGK